MKAGWVTMRGMDKGLWKLWAFFSTSLPWEYGRKGREGKRREGEESNDLVKPKKSKWEVYLHSIYPGTIYLYPKRGANTP